MDAYSILLDAPDTPARDIQIAKLGSDFKHPRHGALAITADDVATWKRNLTLLPGGRAPIDEDHMADRTPRRTEASGWITDVHLDGSTPRATVEWTDKGEDAIRNKRYLFISPTYGPFKDEHGITHDNTLIGAALTNRPFLNMPAITLANEERVSEALELDPAARFYAAALDGDYGDQVSALVTLDVPQAERDKAKANNNSLPDGSYPINNAKQLKAAAILAASKHGNWKAALTLIKRRAGELGVAVSTLAGFSPSSDSRRRMDTEVLKALDLDDGTDAADVIAAITALKAPKPDGTLLKLLDLGENADEQTIVKAIEKLQKKANKKDDVRTLEQEAAKQGLVILDAGRVKTLEQQAQAGEAAMKQLHSERFDRAFVKAVEQRKVTPAERDSLEHFYTLDADATLKALDARQPIVAERPSGPPALEFDPDNPATPEEAIRAGVHPDSHQLDGQIRKHMLENKIPAGEYVKIFEQVQAGTVVL